MASDLKHASAEHIAHTVRKRTFRSGLKERKEWKKGSKYYSITNEELDELERRASR